MSRFNNVIFGQKAFILSEGKILLIKRKEVEIFEGFWDVPGGKLEKEDSLYEGIAREIKEEVGLKLTKVLLILSTTKFEGDKEDYPTIIRNIYLCNAVGEINLSKEHSEYKWVKPEDLVNYKFPNHADLQSVLKNLPIILSEIDKEISYSELF